ncbi:MAG TPA: hypothetical protein VL400_24065 [Polyangiaceae bacterium]|nr:hypothetical protein [Polyangiaceae bacterium]
MTRFGTDVFRFDLPGDTWVEQTVQVYTPPEDQSTAFMLARDERTDDPGADLETAIRIFPNSRLGEVELVQSKRSDVGPLDAKDTSFIIRSRLSADYMRVVSVGYYELELRFCWAGPASARESIDARAEHTMKSARFRRR